MPLICATRFAANSKPVSAHPALLIDAATGAPLKVAGASHNEESPSFSRRDSGGVGQGRYGEDSADFAAESEIFLIVPGLHDSDAGHWQSLWQQRFNLPRMVQPDWDTTAAALK